MRRNVGSLSRELRRNGQGRLKYEPDIAQRMWEKRKHQQHRGKLDKHPLLKQYVEDCLLDDWSPEQITGRLKETPPEKLIGLQISHESIYHYVYEKAEKYKKLYKHLRTNRPKRKQQGHRKSHKIRIPERKSIHERPAYIQKRNRFGDWESDSMIFSKQKTALSLQFERKSKLVRIHKMERKTAEETKDAIIATAESVPKELFRTITFDNGSENTLHTRLKEEYGIETYFCDSYKSYQKGGVENTNKLLRQYLPRKTDLKTVRPEELKSIEQKLNNRPRKSLNYQTPHEVINKVLQ
jgi:IS30 family transposase